MLRLRANWVLPVCSPPIQNGEVDLDHGIITYVGPARGEKGGVRDLGNAILMPGLINVHTHLEYTVMRGLIEDIAFFPWLRELMRCKLALDGGDWAASATVGAMEAVAGGVTTIADCTDSGAALHGAMALGLRGDIYQEVFGIDEAQSAQQTVDELARKVEALGCSATGSNLRLGISPHAPYTVRPELFRALARYRDRHSLRSCIHAAESDAERALLMDGAGPFAEMFTQRGIDWSPPHTTTVRYLASLDALNSSTLLVHGVNVQQEDVQLARSYKVGWAHCPKSNAKLGNGVAPLHLLRSCGPTGLGSDSVASNNTMDLFDEMRHAVYAQRAHHRDPLALTARDAVHMATIDGARALGLETRVGALASGMAADVIAVSLEALAVTPCYDPYNALVYSGCARDVVLTIAAGRIVYDGGAFPTVDADAARTRFVTAVNKLRAAAGYH